MFGSYFRSGFSTLIDENMVECELTRLSDEKYAAEKERRNHLKQLLQRKHFIENTWPAFAKRMLNLEIRICTMYGYGIDVKGDVHRFMLMRQPFGDLTEASETSEGDILSKTVTISLPYAASYALGRSRWQVYNRVFF